VHGTEHMVIGEQVVKAQVLDRGADPPDSRRILVVPAAASQ
jgi:hypothetical protein